MANEFIVRNGLIVSGSSTYSGHLYASTDNTYDIGAAGANRPRNIEAAGAITIGNNSLLRARNFANDGYRNILLVDVNNDLQTYGNWTFSNVYTNNIYNNGVSDITINATSANNVNFVTNNITRWKINSTGSLITHVDNTYDIGAAGANRPRNIYIGGTMYSNQLITSGSATITGSLSISSSLNVSHIIGNSTTPSILIGTGAGIALDATASITGTDLSGKININTGALPQAGQTFCTVTFNKNYSSEPIVVISPANDWVSNVGTGFYVSSSISDFAIKVFGTGNDPNSNSNYKFNYIIIQ